MVVRELSRPSKSSFEYAQLGGESSQLRCKRYEERVKVCRSDGSGRRDEAKSSILQVNYTVGMLRRGALAG